MSFNPPQITPSFATNRAEEDNYWKQKTSNQRASQSTSSYAYSRSTNHLSTDNNSTKNQSIKDKLGGLIGGRSDKELPLYKDKPRFPSSRKGWRNAVFPRNRRKRWIALGVVILILGWWVGIFSFLTSSATTDENGTSITTRKPQKEGWWAWWMKEEIDWNMRRNLVRQAFVTSWDDYARHAWGMDEYSPVAKKGRMMVGGNNGGDAETKGAGLGWIIVDGLDTAMMMNLTSRVADARQWIKTSLDFKLVDGEVSTFETTIRVLGGLLSAHYLSTTFPNLAAQKDDDAGARGEDLYIEKAVDLADRILGAFETPSGIPLASVNLNTSMGVQSHDFGGVSSTAEVATLQLELKYLSKVTGEPLYWEKAEQIMKVIDEPRREGGLVPIYIDPSTGAFRGENIRLGSRGDSYYEYLVKQYLQTGGRESVYNEMWEEALAGIKKYLISWSANGNFTVLGERQDGLKGDLSGKMDHLACFLPGTIALGVTGGETVAEAKKRLGSVWGRKQEEDLLLAEELMKTCWGTYAVTPTNLAPEITFMVLDSPPRQWPSSSSSSTEQSWTQPRSSITFDIDSRSRPKPVADALETWRKDFDIHPNDVHNLQRPETVESLFYMYRITRNEKYRHWGWQMFKAFTDNTKILDTLGRTTGYTSLNTVLYDPTIIAKQEHTLPGIVAGGGTGMESKMIGTRLIKDINNGGKLTRDSMEGFWLAETLKYFYLLFSDEGEYDTTKNTIPDEWFDIKKVVINTEAHFFPRFDIAGSNVWKTGWTRKPRGASTGAGGGNGNGADASVVKEAVKNDQDSTVTGTVTATDTETIGGSGT